MAVISYFKDKVPVSFSSIVEKYKDTVFYKRIGIVDWWSLNNNEYSIYDLKQFLESNEVTFFYSSEILDKSDQKKTLENISSLMLSYNVYYVIHATDDRFVLPFDVSRRYEVPWFVKGLTSVYIPDNFQDSINFTDKQYAFSILLGKNKANRSILYRAFKDNPNFYCTYFGHPKFKKESSLEYESKYTKKILTEMDGSDTGTCTLVDIQGIDYAASHIIPADIFNNSHFSIISESNHTKEEHFLTEKTGNQFLTSRFFLWYSSPKVSVYLQRYGISLEDWQPWIFFDDIEDDIERMSVLIDTAEEISNSKTLQKEIYKKTKLSRRNNRLRYMDLVRDYYTSQDQFVYRVLQSPNNQSLI